MSKPMQTASIAAPGFYGLNTQESSVTLAAGFALQADNCVIDKFGRLGARKGFVSLTGPSSTEMRGVHRFLDIAGTEYFGVWDNDDFYIYDGSSTLIEVPYVGSNTITNGNWQAATLNDAAFLFQRGYKPVYFSPLTGEIDDVENVTNNFVPEGHCVLSAYGRLWVADLEDNKTTVYWSDLLDGTDFQTGSSGSIDLSSVLVKGNDKIVGIGAHAGRLIIFCEDNIVIYADTDSDTALDPATMQLVEVINGVGCVARDTIQNTGTDIVFLAKDGVRSLGRLIQEKSQPMRDLSKNVRDDLIRDVEGVSDTEVIRAVYYPKEAFYLLLIPDYNRIYCFDMRQMLQDGSARVTLWDDQTHTNMYADGALYFIGEDGLGIYSGYTDYGQPYTMRYYTNYFDFGDSTQQKFLKRVSATVIGGSGQDLKFKVGFDYSDSYRTYVVSTAALNNAEFGIAEYNTTAEYTLGTSSDTVRMPLGGSGSVVQIGIESTIEDAQLSIQKMDMYIKQGRIY